MKGKVLWPALLIVLFALTRWPGFLPLNFSAAYALMFCAGVYFPARMAWGLSFGVMLATDLLLNWYYHYHYQTPFFSPDLLGNYVAYAVLVWLGRRFNRKSAFASLVGGGILGAILFYLITNTLSWLFNPFHNPEYTRTLAGWIIALTKGTAGWPSTWEFFRNNLLSGGLFTALFVGAMKLVEATEPETEAEKTESPEAETEAEPREAKA